MKLTPINLTILLHIYIGAESFEKFGATSGNMKAKDELLNNELIVEDIEQPSGHMITRKGEVFLYMILNTPLPVLQYIDPRTGA